MDSIAGLPSFLRHEEYPLHWQMAGPEKAALIHVLEQARPEVALEIGTYRGGSLQVLSSLAGKVYSIDYDPQVALSLQGRFTNVEFWTGHSEDCVPRVLQKIARNQENLGFVLVDGNHTTEAVRTDLNLLLQHVPRGRVFILMHDSFNPDCRRGILQADWKGCPHVHFLEIDFQAGEFFPKPIDTAAPCTMWGGLALAVLLPHKRSGDLAIQQSRRGLFDALYAQSWHHPFRFLPRKMASQFKRAFRALRSKVAAW